MTTKAEWIELARTLFHRDYPCEIDFDMSTFFQGSPYEGTSCSACAVGVAFYKANGRHAAYRCCESSQEFIDFASFHLTPGNFTGDEWYDWCFHASWDAIDNTPEGAAFRIMYALNFGIPSEFANPMCIHANYNHEEYEQLKSDYWHVTTELRECTTT